MPAEKECVCVFAAVMSADTRKMLASDAVVSPAGKAFPFLEVEERCSALGAPYSITSSENICAQSAAGL